MPDVPYLSSEDSIDASRLNTLFQELDRKLSIALDNHSLCFWYQQTRGLIANRYLGQKFCFFNGTPRFLSTILGTSHPDYWNYDHSKFSTVAANSPEQTLVTPSVDHARRMLLIKDATQLQYTGINRTSEYGNGSFFDFSLEAHTRPHRENPADPLVPYNLVMRGDSYIQGGRATYPELTYKWANVELIFENITGAIAFPAEYNKYNFFRIHNLSGEDLTVLFPGFSTTIPARGSKCVRRDSVTSGYLEGFNHFHRFKEGDPWFYCRPANAGLGFKVQNSQSNNVANPSLIFPLVWEIAQGAGIKWILDQSKFWDASGLYSPDYFPAITDATLLGDLLYHKGTLGIASVSGSTSTKDSVRFNGFASIGADFAAKGITVTETVEGDLRLQKTNSDLVTLSTNLVLVPDQKPVKSSPITLPMTHNNGGLVFAQDRVQTNTGVAFASFPSGATASIQLDLSQMLTRGLHAAEAYSVHKTTVATVKSMNLFGFQDYNSSNQQTAYLNYASKQLRLTGFGPVFTTTAELSLAFRPPTGTSNPFVLGIIGNLLDASQGYTLSGTTLAYQRVFTWNGYGFPSWAMDLTSDGSGNPILPSHGAFQTPRYAARHNGYIFPDLSSSGLIYNTLNNVVHPDIIHPLLKNRAEDSTVGRQRSIEKLNIKVLAPYSSRNVFAIVAAWWRGDAFKIKHPRFGTIWRDYNFSAGNGSGYTTHRATLVNNDSTGLNVPGFGDVVFDRMPLQIEHYNNFASVVNAIVRISPLHFTAFYNTLPVHRGIMDLPFGNTSPFRPANQFSGFTGTLSPGCQTLMSLGVQMRTEADFPAVYHQLLAATNRVLITPNPRFEFPQDIRFEERPQEIFLTQDWKASLFGSTAAVPSSNYRWFTIEDVEDVAESLGFKFVYQEAVIPMKLIITSGVAFNRIQEFDNFNERIHPARFAAFISVTSPGETEWVRTPDTYRVRNINDPPDIFLRNTAKGLIEIVPDDERWLFRNYAKGAGTPGPGSLYTARYVATDDHYEAVLFRNIVSAGWTTNCRGLAFSASTINWGSRFASQSEAHAVFKIQYSFGGLQATLVPGAGGSNNFALPTGSTWITPDVAGYGCADLAFFFNNLVSP